MLDANQISELEQSRAALSEMIPPLAKSLFGGFIREGFNASQALYLTGFYITNLGGCQPPSDGQDTPDDE